MDSPQDAPKTAEESRTGGLSPPISCPVAIHRGPTCRGTQQIFPNLATLPFNGFPPSADQLWRAIMRANVASNAPIIRPAIQSDGSAFKVYQPSVLELTLRFLSTPEPGVQMPMAEVEEVQFPSNYHNYYCMKLSRMRDMGWKDKRTNVEIWNSLSVEEKEKVRAEFEEKMVEWKRKEAEGTVRRAPTQREKRAARKVQRGWERLTRNKF